MQICSVINLTDKFKLDCLLKTSILWLFKNELVTLLTFTILLKAET